MTSNESATLAFWLMLIIVGTMFVLALSVLAGSHDNNTDPGDYGVAFDCEIVPAQKGWGDDGRLVYRCKIDPMRYSINSEWYNRVKNMPCIQDIMR